MPVPINTPIITPPTLIVILRGYILLLSSVVTVINIVLLYYCKCLARVALECVVIVLALCILLC
ncbi:uncharacterized protein M421DRAFT_398509 [Didymella exigua CBS 183.55]|uniref:Uncharacterized protein n=1 Tax=Didymella exigua CBS 183.55 TaxID=1150837 RepID=A0A6A5RBI1_9PLEO|nr:uncharacterized protein M421DRAFT_398509 [Didymella exigua CBS 183.55]KAF1925595.1 hypothetical protein M421DRAFT_398509 [Didymella exigua CBS 183.55]